MRLISLCPSITQLVFDLGMGHALVGITQYCIHPSPQVDKIEKVGGTKNPDLHRIKELAPDLALLNKEENRREDWEAIEASGIKTHVSFPITMDQTVDFVLELGAVLGQKEKACAIAQRIETARKTVSPGKSVNPPTWAYLIWRKPWMTINQNTYIHHVLSEAGGCNVFGSMEADYPAITAKELGMANPDLVFLSSEPFPFKEKHIQELSQSTGLAMDKFKLVDGELLSWHGCYTERGLLYAANLFGQGSP